MINPDELTPKQRELHEGIREHLATRQANHAIVREILVSRASRGIIPSQYVMAWDYAYDLMLDTDDHSYAIDDALERLLSSGTLGTDTVRGICQEYGLIEV